MIRLAASRRTLMTLLPLTAVTACAEANTGWKTTVAPAAQPPAVIAAPAPAPAPTAVTPAPSAPLPAPRKSAESALKSTHALQGIASYYWQEQMTATGERFDKTQLTAAHKTLPFGTRVKVTNLANGRTVVVRINDRGPFKPGRIIDLSEAAAREIDMTAKGLTQVALDVVQ